ncbi:hypothetical protein SAMN04487904_112113 [Actinopolyspora lacussalsi subsp. righensis]|uniref:PE family protein n=1 Tax=Actinopolyspora righensis TaxID=995060 RepID=A0A1I7BRF8_9ACTN|nr:hypothetical protein [Actinopolyspora righensis]SFT89784.1 hypothetical protein SAMN04487904_112113 [Actinopolyspora righensis]
MAENNEPPTDEAEPIEMDAADQAAMENTASELPASFLTGTTAQKLVEIARIQERANDKARLAEARGDNTRMVVDPEEVDGLASFFEDKAEELQQRVQRVQELGSVPAPGTDPVSAGATEQHSRVGAGDDRAYLENYLELVKVFQDTAASLRSSAKQTRTDDAEVADSLERGGNDLA